MGKKRKSDVASTEGPAAATHDTSKKKTKKQYHHSDSEYLDNDNSQVKTDPSVELNASVIPSKEVLFKLLDRIEAHLPKEDHVKFDSRVKKLDWEKIKFDELSGEECQKYWYYIQERIRRFRILAELIPEARTWISQPWTNFYKSKDHNRHPDMPKKPLSMYMLFYSKKRAKIIANNPTLTMPEVAKICSEQYQKLSEKKKAKYKQRSDEMRKVYDQKLRDFYESNPEMRPSNHEKQKKAQNQSTAQVQTQIQQTSLYHQAHQVQQTAAEYPFAPEKPAKPYDLYFKQMMDRDAGYPNFDKASAAEMYRKEWKVMKIKKKAKWIKKAYDMFREYEEKVFSFCQKNPGYIKPTLKNFLTQEDQCILDKVMGRPEKPPPNAYSLFYKEMHNNIEIKKVPPRERMVQISEKWKILPQDQKDCYKSKLKKSMGAYRQRYDDWFNGLTEVEREAETARLNSNKSKGKSTVTKIKTDMQILQQPTAIIKSERATLLNSILAREPQEPARSPKQFFISKFVSKSKKKKKAVTEAKDAWRAMDKKDKKKWIEKLEPKRQKYIDEYTLFVRGLDKEELELYTELKQKRDEEEGANRTKESSDSESETHSDSD